MGKDPWSNWTILNAEEICWSVTSVISQKCLLDLCMLVLFTLAVCGSCYLRKKMLYFTSQKSRCLLGFFFQLIYFSLFFFSSSSFPPTSPLPLLTFYLLFLLKWFILNTAASLAWGQFHLPSRGPSQSSQVLTVSGGNARINPDLLAGQTTSIQPLDLQDVVDHLGKALYSFTVLMLHVHVNVWQLLSLATKTFKWCSLHLPL